MPKGAQSLQPFTPTVFTSQTAAVYKANIDGNASVVSNVSGVGYVYPTSPASMSVRVDMGFNTPRMFGAVVFLNSGAGPVTVALVAPGSNSRYACIYWDPQSLTVGVVYSATSASPAPTPPDAVQLISLAYVLLTAGMSSVQASNIFDVRSALPASAEMQQTVGFASGVSNPTIDCTGVTAIAITGNLTTSPVTIGLANLRSGVEISILVFVTGATRTLFLGASTPQGNVFTNVVGIHTATGAFTDMIATGIPIPVGFICACTSMYNLFPSLYFTVTQ